MKLAARPFAILATLAALAVLAPTPALADKLPAPLCGSPAACTAEGEKLMETDPAKAAPFLESGCEGGDVEGCALLGVLLYHGKGVAKDVKRAAELSERACDAGAPGACRNAAIAYRDGDPGLAADPARAEAIFAKGCDLEGGQESCYSLAELLSERDKPDHVKAAAYYARSCPGQARGCLKVGVGHYEGKGVPKDLAKAMVAFGQGCDGKEGQACFNLAVMHAKGEGTKLDKQKAVGLLERACDGDYAQGCRFAGGGHYNGDAGAQDLARALTYFGKGCELGDQDSCSNRDIVKGELATPEITGAIKKKSGKSVTVAVQGSRLPPKDAKGELSKYFDEGFMKGWLGIAEVTVLGTKPGECVLQIDSEKSEIKINGKKVDHFKKGNQVKLTWKNP